MTQAFFASRCGRFLKNQAMLRALERVPVLLIAPGNQN
jgi:hypothetical protein